MSQWGQQQGFQYPMQTGYAGGVPQPPQGVPFQQQPPFQQQQGVHYQPNPPFQQGGINSGLIPQMTGMPAQRPSGFPSQTTATGPAFLQSQPTGFSGAGLQQPNRSVQHASAVPPVPQIPQQFQQYTSGNNFLNPSSQQQAPNRFLSPSPGLGQGLMAQPTGFAGRSVNQSLLPQMTGFVDPRLQMMTNTFMPTNTAAPYNPAGLPQLIPQQNLQQSFQQHNEAQRGAPTQQLSWELTKAEKKKYNDLFRTWDSGNTGFIDGQTALEVFGVSGLPKDDLARIWTLADIDDRGKLNIAEFHIAMGLIFRRLNGMPIPDRLPTELVPPSARDLDSSVEVLKDILKHETGSRSRSPLGVDSPVSRLKSRTFNGASSLESSRDATIYKHSDTDLPGGVYKPASRHIKRDDVRSRSEANSPAGDLSYIKKQLANTASMLDQAAEAEASRTAEDEELDREMDDLKYRVKRMQDDLDYVSRGPRSVAKDEERRRLEREMLSLMHERIPEVERRMKARDERREKERRQWARDRDRTNEKFGRFDSRDSDIYSNRFDEPDRSYSRGYDEGRSFRESSKSPPSAERMERRGHPANPTRTTSPRAKSPTVSVPSVAVNDSPTVSTPKASPSPAPLKNMTLEERQAYARAEAQRRIQARMAALGVTAPSSPSIDTTVEDRLQQEKKEAEEKARVAEKQAEERERLRRERLEQEKAVKGVKSVSPPPTSAVKPPVISTPAPTPVARAAPPPPKPRAPAPPPPRKVPPAVVNRPVVAPTENEVDPLEKELRAREDASRKQREEQARRLKLLEEQEEAARLEEERYKARIEALKSKQSKTDIVSDLSAERLSTPVLAEGSKEPEVEKVQPSVTSPAPEKATNPFNRLLKEGGNANASVKPGTSKDNNNSWSRPSVPATPSSVNVGGNYQTAPSSNDGDWDDVKEIDDDSDSSDDEMRNSRDVRANIAQQLFGNMLPRSESTSLEKSPASPLTATNAGSSVPPPPPPPPPQPSHSKAAATTPSSKQDSIALDSSSSPGDVGALLQSIQSGMKLRPTKTIDKSAPGVTGRVLGSDVPPASSVQLPPDRGIHSESQQNPKNNNRQSVDWFASRAADTGAQSTSFSNTEKLPSTIEDEEEVAQLSEISPPEIQVHEAGQSNMKEDDIDKTIEYRVRTLYAFESENPDDLSFDENTVLVANPSKSDSDWWYGTRVKDGKAGLFPKTYIKVTEPKRGRALFSYTANNSDELSFDEGAELSIVDTSDSEWWRVEDAGNTFVVPAAYLEIIEDYSTISPLISKPDLKAVDDADISDSRGSEDSDYLSFEESEDEYESKSREHERQLVLEAAGLVVQSERQPNKSAQESRLTKILPPVPSPREEGSSFDQPQQPSDAFARYEEFKNSQQNNNHRLSVISSESSYNDTQERVVEGRYTNLLHRYRRNRTPDIEKKPHISAPIVKLDVQKSDFRSPLVFGSSWTSLVDESVLNDMPLNERLRQEAIFELIATEVAYVHDLQLIVEIYYSSLLPLLSSQEVAVIFANIEDILLINTAFLSALEERQRVCRLYIDQVGDILERHFLDMNVYIEYCVNHANSIKALQSLKESNPQLMRKLQAIQDSEPLVRSLDLGSYLLSPMQRITRYPLLLKQILSHSNHTSEVETIQHTLHTAEKLLNIINDTIKFQESQDILKKLSQTLWVGQGHLDLTAPTKHMGIRKLIKEGILLKAKSGRKLHAFLCSDILILTDESVTHLYKMPIPLVHYSIKELSKDKLCFQIHNTSSPKSDYITVKAISSQEYQNWVKLINETSHICVKHEKQFSNY